MSIPPVEPPIFPSDPDRSAPSSQGNSNEDAWLSALKREQERAAVTPHQPERGNPFDGLLLQYDVEAHGRNPRGERWLTLPMPASADRQLHDDRMLRIKTLADMLGREAADVGPAVAPSASITVVPDRRWGAMIAVDAAANHPLAQAVERLAARRGR